MPKTNRAVHAAQQAQDLLLCIQEAIQHVTDHDVNVAQEAQGKALKAARELITALEPPESTILHHCFDGPPLNMCVRVATDMRLFRIIDKRDPSPITSEELAEACGADRSLLVRVMRLLVAAGYAAETKGEVYVSTPLTKAMNTPMLEACIKHRYDIGLPALASAPAFFESTKYQSTLADGHTAFQEAFKTDLGFYDYLAKQPAIAENFQTYMKSFQLRIPPWVDTFPAQERIVQHFQDNRTDDDSKGVLLVDVAGGRGQDLRSFQRKFRHVPGARAYSFHRIFTHWSDEASVKILRNTVSAMTPGYSKLIIHEAILPAEHCSWQMAAFDVIMMTTFSGSHRSESAWRSLLTSIGLQDIRFSYPPGMGDGFIEAMRIDNDDQIDARVRARTYHTTGARYALPNDSIEYARLQDQASGLAELMHNHFIHTPLQRPQRLLDIGCGTGIVACELGTIYPNAQIYGIDLSPVPSHQKPANVQYIQGDIRQLLNRDDRLPAGSVDFIFSRLLILGMTDWQSYIHGVAALLKPGGWAEMQDYSMDYYVQGECCSERWGWLRALNAAAAKKGWDLRCGRRIKEYMEVAGLVDVQVKEYWVPFGTWAVGKRPETRRIGEHAAREYGTMYYHAIPKMLDGMNYSTDELERFREECSESHAAQEGKELPFYVTTGKKL